MYIFSSFAPLWLLLVLLGVAATVTPGWGQTAANGYQLVLEEDFVRIYEKWIPQKNQETVREVKVEFTVYADVQRILECLQQEELTNQWTKNHSACKVTSRDKATWEVDVLYPLPWPARNQEAIMAHRLDHLTEAGFHLSLTSVDLPHSRLDSKAALVLKTKGSWTATRQSGGGYLLTYKIVTLQDRVLPRWLTDPIVHNNLVNSMAALRELAQLKTPY